MLLVVLVPEVVIELVLDVLLVPDVVLLTVMT
jgi:hypothetical protein